jgi:hypothetical protein
MAVGTVTTARKDRHHFGRELAGWSILWFDDFILLGAGGNEQREEYRKCGS